MRNLEVKNNKFEIYTIFTMFKKLTDEEKEDYEDLFDLIDKDKSGSIEMNELQQVLKSVGFKLTVEEVQTLTKETDKNGDGVIDKAEFMRMIEAFNRDDEMESELMEAFFCFDKNKDGQISEEELLKGFTEIGYKGYNQEKLMSCADLDGDRKVNYEEFLKILRTKMK